MKEPNTEDAPVSETTATDEEIWNELTAADDTAPLDGEAADIEDNSDEDDAFGPDSDDDQAPNDEAPEDIGEADEDATPVDLHDQNARLETELKRRSGKVSALQRKVNALQKQLEASQSAPPEGDTEDDDRDLDSIAEEYEDVAGPLVKQVRKLQGRLDEFSASNDHRAGQAEAELEAIEAEQMDALLGEHPDGLDVIKNNRDVFREWIEDQPKKFRDIFETNKDFLVDGTGAALLINRFKIAIGEETGSEEPTTEKRLQSRRQRQLSGARTAPAGRRGNGTAPLESLTDPDEIWDYYERMDQKAKV